MTAIHTVQDQNLKCENLNISDSEIFIFSHSDTKTIVVDSSLYSACHNFVVFQFLYRSQMIDYFVGALMSQSIPTGYIPRGLAKQIAWGGQNLTFESCPGAGMVGILWKFKVERLVRILVLLVINTRCPKNC